MPAGARQTRSTRKGMVVAICLGVAALHLVTGPDYHGPLRGFVTGYLIDLLLPFAMVLLLGVTTDDLPVRVPALARAGVVLLVGIVVEWLQARGVPLFGRTGDLLDVVAYAGGAAMALVFERVVFGHHRSLSA